ncbi:competence protein CoiA family protein [Psychrobacillus sp. FJAT-51614]|uniref:Competence protein CoiA family protein n=1 Tax=Psychrobacillus mangrovi TaxID=3117745 RepID=A0ABU8F3W6_9BACI
MLKFLTAITKHGQVFIPANYSKEHLRELKKHNKFSCLQCREEVILKNGPINIPHFAHRRKSDCINSFSEGETEDHLNGKFQLFAFFQQKNVQAYLEEYIPSINQRPDILIKNGDKLIAIEYQCSQLPASLLIDRSNGYKKQSVNPLWILKTPSPSELPTKEIGVMQLSSFKKQFFLTYPTYGKTIITYCPHTKHFHYISNTLHIKTNTYITKIKKLSINDQTWPFAIIKRISFEEYQKYFNLYQSYRLKHINHLYFYNRRGIQSVFLQICYRWRLSPQKLPLFIGIPTANAEVFHVHAVEWQIQLLDYLNKINVPINSVNTSHCKAFIQDRPIGPVNDEQKLIAVKAYINILNRCMLTTGQKGYDSYINFPKMVQLLYSDFLAN